MRKSPRDRRLEADFRSIQQLSAESSIFKFECRGNLPELYRFFFHGPGTYKTSRNTVAIRERHEIVVELAAAYPRLMPGLSWQTPVFHPNISSSGVVCLGGYGTNWVPSLRLDELCVMLWDMIRYRNYDVESPYNREAAMWAREQADFRFPLDERPLRNRVGTRTDEIVTAQVVHRNQLPPVIVDVSRPAGPADEALVEVVDGPPQRDNDGIVFLD
jgi:ubiquitin-protein ligase